MAGRQNGPLAGPVLGTKWEKMKVGKPIVYTGTRNGAKANVSRANRRYPDMRFRSYKKDNAVWIERVE